MGSFKSRIILPALFAILTALPGSAFSGGWELISPDRVYTMIKEGSGLWLIDVRGPLSFKEGHIEGSVNIPATTLSVKRFPRKKILVLADDSLGLKNAKDAASTLVKNGHERVFVLEGGIIAWEREGYPFAGVSTKETARKVMARELKWAVENNVPLRILDLRGKDEIKGGSIPGSQAIEGEDMQKKLMKLRNVLAGDEKKGLAGKLEGSKTAVLIFPITVNVKQIFEQSLGDLHGDIRYLEGGYGAWALKRGTKVTGSCPTCPASKRGEKE